MIIEIPYDGRIVKTEIDDTKVQDIIEPVNVPSTDETLELNKSVVSPLMSPSLEEFISDAQDLLIVVNDNQRPIVTPRVLDRIWEKISLKKCRFIVATGSHNPPSDTELLKIFGKYYEPLKNEILIHISKNDNEMVFIGKTGRGTNVKLNKILFESDKIITITTVEPHIFAGYTGGRKSIIPGLASYETIEGNHRYAIENGAENLILEGNPVNEDMYEILGFIADKKIYSIQVVLDKNKKIYKAFGGNIDAAFRSSVSAADEIYSVPVKDKADVIVAVPFSPLDENLYQAHKAIENAKPILKEGGILILAAACRNGIGPDNFYKLLLQHNDPNIMLEKFKKDYHLGEHKSAKIARLQTWASIWVVSEMKPEMLEAIRFRPFSSIQNAVDEAIAQKAPAGKVTFLMDGGITVPRTAG